MLNRLLLSDVVLNAIFRANLTVTVSPLDWRKRAFQVLRPKDGFPGHGLNVALGPLGVCVVFPTAPQFVPHPQIPASDAEGGR